MLRLSPDSPGLGYVSVAHAVVPPHLQPKPPAHMSGSLGTLPSSVLGAWTEERTCSGHKRNTSAFRNNRIRAQVLWYLSSNPVQSHPSLLQAETGSTALSVHSPALYFTGCSETERSSLVFWQVSTTHYLILHPRIREASRSPISWHWGYHLLGGSPLPWLQSPAQRLFFQASSAYGGLKTSAFPPCLGHCLLCGFSNPYKRNVRCWLGPGVVVLQSGCPLFSLLQLHQWALWVLCCLPSHRVIGLMSLFPLPSFSL